MEDGVNGRTFYSVLPLVAKVSNYRVDLVVIHLIPVVANPVRAKVFKWYPAMLVYVVQVCYYAYLHICTCSFY